MGSIGSIVLWDAVPASVAVRSVHYVFLLRLGPTGPRKEPMKDPGKNGIFPNSKERVLEDSLQLQVSCLRSSI